MTSQAHVTKTFFWWKFWKPFQAIGGPVRFGNVCKVQWREEDGTTKTTFQTPFQVEQKRSLGWIE
jgi:hypothetical protein